jgi:hypothetical protein
MSPRRSSDASAVLTAAAMAGLLALLTNGRDIASITHRLLVGVGVLAAVGFVAFVCLAAARVLATRRALARRVTVVVLAPDSFDPGLDGVLRFASQLSRVRRMVGSWLDARASAVRVLIDSDPAGRMRYSLSVPARSLPAIRSALSAYDRVQIRPADAASERTNVGVVRCELRLARASHDPLARLALDPDPLQGFARLITDLNEELGESVEVAVDLLPSTAGARRRLRRRLLRQAHRASSRPGLGELLGGSERAGRGSAGEMVGQRAEREEISSRLLHSEPMFKAQILLRCSSRVQGRAREHMQALLGCFDAFAAVNSLRVAGMRVLGLWFLGSDIPGRRGWFDRRMASGLFWPVRESVLTAREIAGLLKPPTVNCRSTNVLRLGPAVHPPPKTLPEFNGQAGLLPLGQVSSEAGVRLVGVGLNDTFFSYVAGRSRFGKTELAISQFLHIVRAGHGGMFIDPHEDAIARIKSCLTENALAERVMELDLTGPRSREGQPGWNLLAVHDLSAEDRERRVEAIVDAFASALGWGERNNRALTLTTQAVAALVELATVLPAGLSPTVFQIATLLSDERWRESVLPVLSAPRRQFFSERFPLLSSEAVTPVTNLIDRLRSSTPLAALLGAQATSYDIARAMNQGRIVLACPGAGGARDKLVANLLVYDLLHAAKSRARVAPEHRRAFYVFLDEIQTYDGASSGNLAALLEQSAKYGIRAVLCNQNPERLTHATLNALTTNRSHLLTTALNAHAAALIAREWGEDPRAEAITSLARHTFLAQVTHNGELTRPFLIHTRSVPDLYPDAYQPDSVPSIQPVIDEASGRQQATETLAALDTLDQRIQEHLARRPDNPQASGRAAQNEPGRAPMPKLPDPESARA